MVSQVLYLHDSFRAPLEKVIMGTPPHIIIYSHGFGTRQDDMGLFPDIVRHFPDIQHVTFDYNTVNEAERTLSVPPFSVQARKLEEVVAQVRLNHPEAIIDIIAHSQGCLVVALARLENIRKVIFLAPKVTNDVQKTAARFAERPGSLVNLEGESTLARSDGSITLVGAKFWQELQAVNPGALYNQLGQRVNLTIIRGAQDTIAIGDLKVDSGVHVLTLPGDHSFNGDARAGLSLVIEQAIGMRGSTDEKSI